MKYSVSPRSTASVVDGSDLNSNADRNDQVLTECLETLSLECATEDTHKSVDIHESVNEASEDILVRKSTRLSANQYY